MRPTMIFLAFAAAFPLASAFVTLPALASDSGRSEAAVKAFITEKNASHLIRQRALVGRGLLGAYELNRAWVVRNTSYLPPALMVTTHDQRTAVQSSYVVDLAQSLTGLGWSAAGMEASLLRGHDILESISLITRGGATGEDFAAVADTVLIARATATGSRPASGDGFRSGLRFVVDEVIKGDYRKGDKVVVRQTSGPAADGTVITLTSDAVTQPGRLYLIVGSAKWYEQVVNENGYQPHSLGEPALMSYGGVVEITENSMENGEVQLLKHAASSTLGRLRQVADNTPVH